MVILPSIRRKYMVRRIPKGASVPMSECVVTLLDKTTHEPTDRTSYTGSVRTLDVLVTWEGATLAVNTDYTLAYANNVNMGPATVTVTGMGQFSGSVTRTFYIVSGSAVPWTFNLGDATLVGTSAAFDIVSKYVMPLVENYSAGSAVLPVYQFQNNHWVAGYSLPRDSDDEYHIANLAENATTLDGDGVGGFPYLFHFDKTRSGWTPISGYVLKMKDGSSFDFTDELDSGFAENHPPCFANDGKILFVFTANLGIVSFNLSTAYDLSTVDVSSKKQATFGAQGGSYCLHCCFSPDGMQSIVCTDYSNMLCHVAHDTPYDFTDATILNSIFVSAGCRTATVTNGGKTLLVGGVRYVTEYNLVP